ncbi:hypothetical protein ACFLY2_00140 [Patescibacteria group bacterium]
MKIIIILFTLFILLSCKNDNIVDLENSNEPIKIIKIGFNDLVIDDRKLIPITSNKGYIYNVIKVIVEKESTELFLKNKFIDFLKIKTNLDFEIKNQSDINTHSDIWLIEFPNATYDEMIELKSKLENNNEIYIILFLEEFLPDSRTEKKRIEYLKNHFD